jgi:hypothetical protein
MATKKPPRAAAVGDFFWCPRRGSCDLGPGVRFRSITPALGQCVHKHFTPFGPGIQGESRAI